MTYITRLLIARPLLTKIVLLLILLLSGVSFFNIKRQAYPRVDFGRMHILTIFPGASPEDVELNVTIKLEDAIKGVNGIDKYISHSMENISFIQIVIDADAEDQEKVKANIRRAVSRVNNLPEEVRDRPYIDEISIDNQPVYEVALTMPGATEKFLRDHARQLKKNLQELNTVARIHERGIQEREIKVLLNASRMARNHVSFDEIIASIKLNKLRVSGGSLESYTNEKGIITLSEFSKPEDVANVIVRSNFVGNNLRIGDVGRVVDGFKKRDTVIKFDGKEGVSLWVAKKGTADVIRSVADIKKVIEDYKKNFAPKGMRFHSTWDASIETQNRLSILYGNALMGLVLVVLILFLFLNPHIAFWTAAGIPLSVGITMILLPLLGITLNSVSILGMVVVLGMIVDDAIIISESIYRLREQGMEAKEAALEGLRTVVKPVLGTIITTMIAFFPMYFIPGIMGKFSLEIPTMVIIMLAASFIEAITILPAHLGHEKPGKKPGLERRPPGQKLVDFLEKWYERLLEAAIRHRVRTLIGFGLFLFSGVLMGSFVTKVDMFPDEQSYRIWIQGELPQGSNLEHTNRRSQVLEKILDEIPAGLVQSYKTIVGERIDPITGALQKMPSNFMVNLTLVPASDRKITAKQITEDIRSNLNKSNPKNDIDLSFAIITGGPPVGLAIEVQVLGLDNDKRQEIIEELRTELIKRHVIDIAVNSQKGKEEVRLIPDYEKIAAAQLNVATVAGTIRTAFDGNVVTYLQTPDERVGFRVIMDKNIGDFKNPLDRLFVRNSFGNLIPVKNLVKEARGRSPQAYYHYNSNRSNKIAGRVDKSKTTPEKVYSGMIEHYKGFEKRYPGYKLIFGGEAEKNREFVVYVGSALLLAIITIYLLLVVQFNSFTQPVMVILAIPFGIVGIIIAFGVQGMSLTMLSMVGILGFTGVVVNDSLIMVDFINRLRRHGTLEEQDMTEGIAERELSPEEFKEAVLKGSRLRLRPIVLTTITTVVGLLPTAYGFIGGFDSFISPLVMSMAWGLLAGTLSVLIIIPVFYTLHADIVNFISRLFKRK